MFLLKLPDGRYVSKRLGRLADGTPVREIVAFTEFEGARTASMKHLMVAGVLTQIVEVVEGPVPGIPGGLVEVE